MKATLKNDDEVEKMGTSLQKVLKNKKALLLLKESRNLAEAKRNLLAFGLTLENDELKNLPAMFANSSRECTGCLTMQQLNDVAGGMRKRNKNRKKKNNNKNEGMNTSTPNQRKNSATQTVGFNAVEGDIIPGRLRTPSNFASKDPRLDANVPRGANPSLLQPQGIAQGNTPLRPTEVFRPDGKNDGKQPIVQETLKKDNPEDDIPELEEVYEEGTSEEDNTEEGTSEEDNTEGGTPKEETPEEDNTEGGTPKEETPEEDNTEGGTPKEEPHKEETPEEDNTEGGTPKEETPEEDNTEGGTPKEETPEEDNTEGGTPKEGTPKEDNTEGVTPKEETPEEDNTEGGTPKEGTPKEDNTEGVTPKEGTEITYKPCDYVKSGKYELLVTSVEDKVKEAAEIIRVNLRTFLNLQSEKASKEEVLKQLDNFMNQLFAKVNPYYKDTNHHKNFVWHLFFKAVDSRIVDTLVSFEIDPLAVGEKISLAFRNIDEKSQTIVDTEEFGSLFCDIFNKQVFASTVMGQISEFFKDSDITDVVNFMTCILDKDRIICDIFNCLFKARREDLHEVFELLDLSGITTFDCMRNIMKENPILFLLSKNVVDCINKWWPQYPLDVFSCLEKKKFEDNYKKFLERRTFEQLIRVADALFILEAKLRFINPEYALSCINDVLICRISEENVSEYIRKFLKPYQKFISSYYPFDYMMLQIVEKLIVAKKLDVACYLAERHLSDKCKPDRSGYCTFLRYENLFEKYGLPTSKLQNMRAEYSKSCISYKHKERFRQSIKPSSPPVPKEASLSTKPNIMKKKI